MKIFFMLTACCAAACAMAAAGLAGERGEELFKQHCSPCHAGGGNIINAAKPLHKEDREAHGVKTVEDIVGKMRNPGPGMSKFDEHYLPDQDARAIAGYILKTF